MNRIFFKQGKDHLVNRVNPVLLILVLLLSATAQGHEGPPFPIIVDQPVGPCIISVWTDPDVGESSFFVIVNAPPNQSLPADLQIQVGVQPVSGRLPEKLYTAEKDTVTDQLQYKALIMFDAQELWRVRVVLQSAQGSGEASATVEATPPGYGRWDLLIYLLPFLAIAGLWLRAMTKKK
jgi:hypothetical protein